MIPQPARMPEDVKAEIVDAYKRAIQATFAFQAAALQPSVAETGPETVRLSAPAPQPDHRVPLKCISCGAMTYTAVTTTIKIVGFTRSYPDHMTIRDFDGSFKRLSFTRDDDLTADIEIDVETDGYTTTHSADLFITCPQEAQLVRLLKWAVEEHRKKSLSEQEKKCSTNEAACS